MKRHPYVPQGLAVRSMRDNGYKNTAYALAELIDNSYQALEQVWAVGDDIVGRIDIIIVEEQQTLEERTRWRPSQIAVVDNGCGMDAETLRMALQFGNGTHLEDRKGIGRFGMGLPNSTVSQCRRADVWSWQSGPANAISTFLDLGMIESNTLEEVPHPVLNPVPDEWLALAPFIEQSDSGTLVVWSDLDRVRWRTARSTLDNTEMLIGRIYRHLLGDRLTIRLVPVREGRRIGPEVRDVRKNDPLYLMAPTSTPTPFADVPMFRPLGENGRQKFTVHHDGADHDIVVTLSWAKDDARLLDDGQDAGKLPYGKHARDSVGVSLVRAGRELVLDTSWSSDPFRDRWWGAEISFPPELDDVFGVTNNKQSATHFTDLADYYRDDRNDNEWQDIQRQMEEDGDPQRHLLELCNWLKGQLDYLARLLKEQTKGTRQRKQNRHEGRVEERASKASTGRAESGSSAGVADETTNPEELRKALTADLIQKRYNEEVAKDFADYVVDKNLKITFVEVSNPEADAFFFVDVLPGVIEVVFNTSHPAHGMLISTLRPPQGATTLSELSDRLHTASDTLLLLLAAWARYEAEEKEGTRKDTSRRVRQDWGRMAKLFLDGFDAGSSGESGD